MTEKLNTKQLKSVSTDVNLGNSDVLIPTQKAVKTYVDKRVFSVYEMPDAGVDYLGRALQYMGESDANYHHGYVYECVEQTEIETLILFNPVGTGRLGFDYANHNVMELFERIAAIETTFNAEDVVSGSFKLDKANELWYIDGYDANGNALFSNFTFEATGGENCLDGFGYIYTYPFPDDFEEGHEEGYTIARETHSSYSWERIDMQPNTAVWGLITGSVSDQTDLVNYIMGQISPVDVRVATIESYIPAQASALNQLADKQYVQAGLDNKQDNLTATDGLTLNNNVISGKILQDDIADINGLIPAQATAQNQLADKAFVNSSIETNTATFRGTYNTLAELEVQTADNNDYGFVVSTDSAGNTVYNRYKYNGTEWVFEYALNNSSFTANQWAAINSNATAEKIAQIDTNKTNIANHIADINNPHSVTKAQVGLSNVDNTSDLNKPISTATQNALDLKADKTTTYTKTETDTLLSGKQDNISDLVTIRSGAALGATAVQPGDNVSALTNDAGYLVMGDLTNFVTKNTAQTISGLKTFTGDIVLSGTTSIKNTTNGTTYSLLWRDASGVHVGASTQALNFAGTNTRPTYNSNNMALFSDIPTVVSALTNDSGYVTNTVNDLQYYTLSSDLATVATSGAYSDLTGLPTLGTAAAADTTDFATAAQGLLADSALQSGDNISELVNDAGYLTRHQTLADLGITATAGEINVLDGITATTTELNYTDGVTSNIQTQLNNKQGTISDLATIRSGASAGATAVQPGDLATVATSGSYNDLSNKPTIPAAQVNSDWNANSGVAQILNKPTLGTMASESASDYTKTSGLAAVARSGSYTDLSDKPTIGNGTITITQGGVNKGTFTTNQSGNTTIEVDAGAGSPVWGGIGGTLSNQTDLQDALDSKANSADVYTKTEVDTAVNAKSGCILRRW